MRFLSVLRKCAREQKRDLWILGLSLAFAPLFVFIYWMFTGGNVTTSYGILVINHDVGITLSDGSNLKSGEEAISAMEVLTFKDGSPILRVKSITDRPAGEKSLRDRDATVLIIIPPDFSQVIAEAQSGETPTTTLEFVGDLTNPYYTVAAVMAITALDSYTVSMTSEYRAVELLETALGGSAARTEFEIYIPGLFVFAVILIMFQAAMMVARDIESGTLQRLKITRLTAFEYLSGTTTWLVLIAVVTILVTFATAAAFGFRSQGALWIAILVGIITSLSIIGVGMIVASFSKTVSQAFVIANFPFGFFMFLSGAAFPVPMGTLFTIAGRDISIVDILPPTHAVAALNKVFTLGVGLDGVIYELCALSLLSVIYFAIGVWLFRRMHLKA
ncbi:MAG: ABC transporter permease [Anaerolineales bacterium]|nr:ABC transporter permease [Anaerolineales bacterium]